MLEGRQETGGATSSANLDELFDELEKFSDSNDSDDEHDNISVRSIRKPTLPLYFNNSETSSMDTVRRLSREEEGRGLPQHNILSTVRT